MAILDDINTLLTAQGVVGGVTGWSMALSYFPDSPDKVVYAVETGGTAPPDDEFRYRTFQIVVRGDAQDPQATRTKAEAALSALDDGNLGASYVFTYANGDVIDIGRDKNDRPMFSINFQTMSQVT